MRHLFSIPREIAYLNAASNTPLANLVRDAGTKGAETKVAPWKLSRPADDAVAERVRGAAGALVGATASDMAIMGSVSHAIATAGRNLAVGAGTRILRLAGEFPSQALEWQRLAAERGAVLDVVQRPTDHDWTAAVLERIEQPGAPVSVAALTPLHWTDGTMLDLDVVAPALRRHGAALVIDATQAAGAMPIDVQRWQPDFLAYPTYKWVLGSYNLAFLYAAPARQHGEPLERNGANCDVDDGVLAPRLREGAARFDMGERNNPVALPMAEAAFGLIQGWGVPAVEAHVRPMTDRLAAVAEALGFDVVPRRFRAAHVLGIRIPGGAAATLEGLARRGVYASDRQGVLRVSPYLYNDSEDLDRFAAALEAEVRQKAAHPAGR